MSKDSPYVSIIIPCLNEVDFIENCLENMLSQEDVSGGYEVIVVDGMSDDGTREKLLSLAEKTETVRVVDNPRRIQAAALNIGIREALGDVIVRIDAHSRYEKDYVHSCVAALEETGADNVGGAWVAKGNGYVSRAIAAAFNSPFSCGGALSHNPNYEGWVDSVYLGCWKRELFDKIGHFNERLVCSEDEELNLRIAQSGGRIWQTKKSRSRYLPRDNVLNLWRQYFHWGHWKVFLMWEHRVIIKWRHIVPVLFALFVSIGFPVAFLSTPFSIAYIGVLLTYGLFLAGASLLCGRLRGWDLVPILPVVFATFHFAYGFGFLSGLWHVFVRRKDTARKDESVPSLTR